VRKGAILRGGAFVQSTSNSATTIHRGTAWQMTVHSAHVTVTTQKRFTHIHACTYKPPEALSHAHTCAKCRHIHAGMCTRIPSFNKHARSTKDQAPIYTLISACKHAGHPFESCACSHWQQQRTHSRQGRCEDMRPPSGRGPASLWRDVLASAQRFPARPVSTWSSVRPHVHSRTQAIHHTSL